MNYPIKHFMPHYTNSEAFLCIIQFAQSRLFYIRLLSI